MNPPNSQDERRARLLDAMPAIAWSASAHTFQFNYINPAAETLLGYPAQRWLDEPNFWTDHLHPDDRHVARLCHNETLACRDHELVYRMITADGRIVWLRDYINVHVVEGEAVELFGVMVDITREMESRENFRRMVELSPDCIGVFVDGTYVYINQAFVRLFGASHENEILGRPTHELLHPDYHELAASRRARLERGESAGYERMKFIRVDGSLVDVEVAALPLRYGNRDAVQVIARDITDRVRAEEELQVREARLQMLASGTHEAIWEWFPERNELWTNDAYKRILGTPSDPDAFFDHWVARVHPDDRERASTILAEAIRGERTIWRHEYRLRQPDGTYAVVLDRGHLAKSPAGERHVIGAMLDVNSLRESERLRDAAEAKFRWLVEQAVVSVYMLSNNRLTYINDTGARMLGYTVEELTSMEDTSVLLDVDQRPDAVFGGGPNVARVRRKDGTILHVAFYQNEVTIDGEKITIGTGADVTESVLAQQSLEASEQRYRELVDGVGDILFTVGDDGCIVSLSRSFERCTGSGVDEWIGRPFTELFRPHENDDADAMQQQAKIHEFELPSPSGTRIVEVSWQPRYVSGVASGMVGMARDVTDSRLIMRKLEEAKRMSSLGQVAASLAHEFNNVLMGIQPFVEVIARQASTSRSMHDALGHITRSIMRGKRASQEVLRFANPKAPQLSPVDVPRWLPTLLGQMVASLPSTVALSSELDPRVRFIRGDREHLEQVITNLVFNARDAINGEGTIHIEVALEQREHSGNGNGHGNGNGNGHGNGNGQGEPEFVRITIRDSGHGVPDHLAERIFEPLFTTKRNGTGLGLTIARRLMEGQGGTLSTRNHPDGGCMFELLVPAAFGAASSLQSERDALPQVKRILIVEDDESVGAGLEELLTAVGYETILVHVSADAGEAARRLRPEVAIIDVNLPDGNGIDLIPILRAQQKNLPVVLSTGHVEMSFSNTEQRILSLMKPYELSDLLTAIGTVTAGV